MVHGSWLKFHISPYDFRMISYDISSDISYDQLTGSWLFNLIMAHGLKLIVLGQARNFGVRPPKTGSSGTSCPVLLDRRPEKQEKRSPEVA